MSFATRMTFLPVNNDTGNKKDWASVKLHRDFARWLKVEAAKGDVYMGDLIEQLAERAVGSRPWRPTVKKESRR